jgi:ankyrin repeat protein
MKNLRNLKNLNVGKNFIKVLSYEVTNIESLETLYIYGNIFESFPVSFKNLQNLKEFAFEWLNYTNPPIDSILKKPMHNHVFERIHQLCSEIANLRLSSISFITFLQSMSLDPIDFTKPDIKTRNLMHLAAIKDELSILINMGREFPELINQIDKENQTPLTLSLLENKSRSIQCLIGIGADPKKGGGQLGSSLHLAAFKLDSKTTEIFLRAGCDPNGQDYDKNTPLHLVFSIFSKNEEESKIISQLLLKHGADPNIKNKDFWTPLHLAVKGSQIKAVIWAIEYNKKCSSNDETKSKSNKRGDFFNFNKKGGNNKLTPMHLAIHNGSLQMIEKLGENNVNMFIENSNLQLPRHLSYHSLLIVKTTRRLEIGWIRKNIIQKNERLLVQPTCEMKMGDIKSRLREQSFEVKPDIGI